MELIYQIYKNIQHENTKYFGIFAKRVIFVNKTR